MLHQTTRQIVDKTKYKLVLDGKVIERDLAYVDMLYKLNQAQRKHGAAVKPVIQ